MKASELRIGNIVQNVYEDTFGISQETLCDFANGYVNLNPVPLTEKWLLKFGLNNPTNEKPYHFKSSAVEFLHSEFQDELKCFCDDKPMFSFPCKYVHQLQNIYYSLTGEELKIK